MFPIIKLLIFCHVEQLHFKDSPWIYTVYYVKCTGRYSYACAYYAYLSLYLPKIAFCTQMKLYTFNGISDCGYTVCVSICYVPAALTCKRKDAMKGESNEHRHVISNNVTF